MDSLTAGRTKAAELSDEELCRLAAKVMGKVLGGTPTNFDVPDKDKTKKNVDLVCEITGRRVWFEHTLMPPFPNKILDDLWARGLADAVQTARVQNGGLPAGSYSLTVDIAALAGVPGNSVRVVAEALVNAVIKHGSSLAPSGVVTNM